MQEDKSFIGLTLSVLIHLGLLLLLIFWPKWPETPKKDVTQITVLDSGRAQDFVTDTKVPQKDLIDQLKEKAKYLSKETKRVKKQTVARRSGQTQNLFELPTPSLDKPQGAGHKKAMSSAGGAKSAGEHSEIHSSLAGLQPKPHQVGGMAGAQEGFGKNLVMGSSSLAEYIPGVEQGSFTALNTDQFTYYTFFERVNEQVRFRWVMYVRQFLASLSDPDLDRLAKYQRIFQIEIVLSSDGHYLKGFIHHTSGENALDMTAIDAFQNAAPFLNPPKGLVEDDGYIHLHYNFIVEFRPRTGLGSN